MMEGRAEAPAALRGLSEPAQPSASLVLFLAMFAGQASLLVLSPMLPAVAADFGVTMAVAGQLRAVSGAVAGVAALALGVIARGRALRDLLIAGLALLALGALASGLAPSFRVLALAQVLVGVGLAFVLGGSLAAAGAWSAPGDRTRVLSWALMGPPVAWILSMPVVGALTDVNWRAGWAVPLVAGVAAVAVVRLREREPTVPAPRFSPRRFMRREVVGWTIGELCANAAWTGTIVYAGARFIESFGVSAATVGLLMAGAALVYLPGNLLARRWVDGRARGLLIVLPLLSVPSVWLFAGLADSPAVAFGAYAALALLAGGRTIAGSAYGLDAAPEDKLAMMSLRTASLQFGYLLGAALGGAGLAAGGYPGLGKTLALLFLLGAAPHALAAVSELARAAPRSGQRRITR